VKVFSQPLTEDRSSQPCSKIKLHVFMIHRVAVRRAAELGADETDRQTDRQRTCAAWGRLTPAPTPEGGGEAGRAPSSCEWVIYLHTYWL